MKIATRLLALLVIVVVLVAAGAIWQGTREDSSAAIGQPIDLSDSSLIEQGRYLAQVGNCMGCHTAVGGEPYAGGRALPTEYGTFYGPNITPAKDAGIGSWTADDFWRALHNGKSKDGSLLYPAFPYPTYTHVSREDADALFAYLQSLPPVDRASPQHELRFPYNQRWLLSVWRALYFEPGAVATESTEHSQQWLRGRYLVDGLAHCAECHTPRGRWGALERNRNLQGTVITGLGWYATPLTGDAATGLGNWTAADIAQLLQIGLSRHSHVAGPMAESVFWGYQHLRDEDALAIAEYLKTLPAAGIDQRVARAAKPASNVMDMGRTVYEQSCAQCHKADGTGEPNAWPPLAGNPSVVAESPLNVVNVVLDGGFPPTTAENPQPHGMPPYRHALSDAQIAAVVSYVRASWGNDAGAVSLSEVRRVRAGSR